MVPALAMMLASTAALSGPMSRIRSSAATSLIDWVVAVAVAENSLPQTTSVGNGTLAPRAAILPMMLFASLTRLASASDLPITLPCASRNVLAMPPPTIN